MALRKLTSIEVTGENSMSHWWKVKNPVKTMVNFVLIYSARFAPSLALKRFFCRLAGAKIGNGVSFGLGAVLDIFYPELIEIGDNSIIGYNSTILAHEFLIKKLKTGNVKIGKGVMVGANCTILAGIEIGDGASIAACSLVNSDVPAGAFAGGVPAKIIKRNH